MSTGKSGNPKFPFTLEQGLISSLENLGATLVVSIDPFYQVEEEQEGELFGVGYRIRVSPAIEIITYLVDRPP